MTAGFGPTVATDCDTQTVGYGYDISNGDRLSSMTYPNGRTISYNYDSGLDSDSSRISSITDSNGSLIQSYQYQGQDTPMVSTSGNGVVGTTVLDSLGRVQSLTYTNSVGAVIDGYSYTYDADDNVTGKTQLATVMSSDSETYSYDGLNRLETFKRGTISNGTITSPTTSESWSLDALGNQKSVTTNGVTVTRAISNQNQIESLSNSSTSLNYDANGNTLNDQTGQTYTYDAWNHLVSVTTPGGDTITYKYDALGRVIAESDSSTGTTTDLYYSSSGQVIEERVNGIVTQQYVWSPFYVNQLVERDTYSGGVFSYRLYAQQDADYNVTSLTDSSGVVVERYIYDPYGAITVLNASGSVLGTGLSSSTVGQQFGFQGGWTVPRTGLTLFGARWLTLNGTWLNEDPTGSMYVNGADLYQGFAGSPVGNVDPSGLNVITFVVGAASGSDDHDPIPSSLAARTFYIEVPGIEDSEIQFLAERAAMALAERLRTQGGTAQDFVDQLPAEIKKWVKDFHPDKTAKMKSQEDLDKQRADDKAKDDAAAAKAKQPSPAAKPACAAETPPRTSPTSGEPGSTSTIYKPDGTPKQIRQFGPDGKPLTDVDFSHGHELGADGKPVGTPHVHDWTPDPDGGFPSRGLPRQPQPGDPLPQ